MHLRPQVAVWRREQDKRNRNYRRHEPERNGDGDHRRQCIRDDDVNIDVVPSLLVMLDRVSIECVDNKPAATARRLPPSDRLAMLNPPMDAVLGD